jgi:histidine triad (HIT) family protein
MGKRSKLSAMSDCVFCKIRDGVIPSKRVHDDDRCFAFRDINPQAPTHFLVVPKEHLASLAETDAAHEAVLGHLLVVGTQLARSEGFADAGWRSVINTGRDGGQTVHHIHLHVLAGRPLHWPPG